MRAKVVVFPIRGRNWCFSRSVDPSVAAVQSSNSPSTLKELWSKIISPSKDSKVELTVDFASDKVFFYGLLLIDEQFLKALCLYCLILIWFARNVVDYIGGYWLICRWFMVDRKRKLDRIFTLYGNLLFFLLAVEFLSICFYIINEYVCEEIHAT